MPLGLVSTTTEHTYDAREPAFGRRWPVEPPVPLASLKLFTSGQPYAAFAQMRAEAPVLWNPEAEGPGFWAVTRYDDVRTVELDTETYSSQKGGINLSYGRPEKRHPLLFAAAMNTMICLDAPYHMPLRREHMPFFTPAHVKGLRERVEAKVASLLDAMAARGRHHDLVEMFSAELPLFTLCEMLGVEEADRPKLVKWMHFLEVAAFTLQAQAEGTGEIDYAFFGQFVQNVLEMFEYGQAVLKARRVDPRNDLLSAIANARIDGELLPDEYLDGSWLLIVFAGNDTTRNSISGTLKLLTEFPDQKARLLADAELMPNMVHEAIRMISPVIYMRRTATRDTELRGQKIASGEKVVMFYGAANRDPEVFADPDRFDVTRANAKDHLAFGLGPHVCLGQRVANMQLEVAWRQILGRFPNIRWTGEIEIAPNNFVHAISKIGVDLG
jgi:cytochrome P450